jgi:hypothetical protein
VTIVKGTLTTNVVSTFALTTSAIQGGATWTNGGSLTIVNSTISKNSPVRWGSIGHQGAQVTLRNVVLEGKKFPGTKVL